MNLLAAKTTCVCIDDQSVNPNTQDFCCGRAEKGPKSKNDCKSFVFENAIVDLRFFSHLLSKQNGDFESETIKELCKFMRDKIRTTLCHPCRHPAEQYNNNNNVNCHYQDNSVLKS